jgi:hypothetical protein
VASDRLYGVSPRIRTWTEGLLGLPARPGRIGDETWDGMAGPSRSGWSAAERRRNVQQDGGAYAGVASCCETCSVREHGTVASCCAAGASAVSARVPPPHRRLRHQVTIGNLLLAAVVMDVYLIDSVNSLHTDAPKAQGQRVGSREIGFVGRCCGELSCRTLSRLFHTKVQGHRREATNPLTPDHTF